jgi:hypothetical protein
MYAWELSGRKVLWTAGGGGTARVCSPPNVSETYVVHTLASYDEWRIEPPIVPETTVFRNVLVTEDYVLLPGQCVDAVEGSLFLAVNGNGEPVECGVVDSKSPSGYRRVECPGSDAVREVGKRIRDMGYMPSLPYTIEVIVELLGRTHGFNLKPA